MSKAVVVVSPGTLFNEVARRMLQLECDCVLVAKDDRLLGIITDRDIALRCVAGEQITSEATAEQVMSPEILYCRDTDSANDVTKIMAENRVPRLAVLDANKRLVGIVTFGEICLRAAP